MINLFEYKNKNPFPEDQYEPLEVFLDDIWSKREKTSYYSEEENREETQRFIQFLHKTKELKSNKYVGVIQFEDQTINLLPKIFYKAEEPNKAEVKAINLHVLWWLSYCRKLKFPNYLSGLQSERADFFEILIYLFSKYTRELLNSSIYQKYVDVERELNVVKGRIDFSTYISNNLSRGKYHKINCVYDSFEMDNEFNRGIKCVASLLLSITQDPQSKRFLSEILFMLDEVKDISTSSAQMKRMSFNPMFASFETVRDYCVLFLENSVSFNYKNSLKLFAFLLPMEYVFEDFIFGFIDKEIDLVKAKGQIRNTHLDESKDFALKPDLHLEIEGRRIIADTKYKIVYSDEKDPKKGISQNDLYQMIAYAIRFNTTEIVLYYPNTIDNYQGKVKEIDIVDELANDQKIEIRAYQLPVINKQLFEPHFQVSEESLMWDFEETKIELIKKIKESLGIVGS